jgi:hypothetical protein
VNPFWGLESNTLWFDPDDNTFFRLVKDHTNGLIGHPQVVCTSPHSCSDSCTVGRTLFLFFVSTKRSAFGFRLSKIYERETKRIMFLEGRKALAQPSDD